MASSLNCNRRGSGLTPLAAGGGRRDDEPPRLKQHVSQTNSQMRVNLIRSFTVALLCTVLPGLLAGATTAKASPLTGDCVRFASKGRLRMGDSYVAHLTRELDFHLTPDGPWGWDIWVGSRRKPQGNYAWVVTPPLQWSPHMMIGPAYGLTARDSATMSPRQYQFVLSEEDFQSAIRVVQQESLDLIASEFERLGKGSLTLAITGFELRPADFPPETKLTEALAWIQFTGTACVPHGQ